MTGTSYTPEKMFPICKRYHDGETKKGLHRAEGVHPQTISDWYERWCKENNLTPRPPEIPRGYSHKPIPTVQQPEIKAAAIPPKIYIPPPVGKRIAVLPDKQIKPGIDLSFCSRIGRYLAEKKPDIIIDGGDFADMPSLNSYDLPGSRGMEGQRYKEDILSVQTAMRLMMTPIKEEMERTGWKPRLVMLLGNHEDRIRRAIEATPKLDGVIGLCDLHYEEHGWEVHPFLEPVVIEGIVFSHYFCSGVMGRPITTARALLNKKHMSCFAFHQQGRDIAFGTRADGHQMIAIIAGSCYEHEESYLNPQTNNHWRGLYILNDVIDGAFEENAVSLKYLRRKYP